MSAEAVAKAQKSSLAVVQCRNLTWLEAAFILRPLSA